VGVIGKGIGYLTGSSQAADAAKKASRQQIEAMEQARAQMGAANTQFQSMYSPYAQAGAGAFGQMQNIAGLGGLAGQQQAVNAIEQGPLYGALVNQGEQALLQNAAATGGVRGGNAQAALAQFRPQMLQQLLDQQYQRLGGIAGMGYNARQAQAQGIMSNAQAQAGLLEGQGAARAGSTMAQGQQWGNTFGTLAGLGGMALGAFGKGGAFAAKAAQAGAAPAAMGSFSRPWGLAPMKVGLPGVGSLPPGQAMG